MSTDADRQLRKQLLLTRIAADRLQWRSDLDDLTQAAHPRSFGRSLVLAAFGPGWLSKLFGAGTRSAGVAPPPAEGLVGHLLYGLTLLRRYPVLLTLAGSALPWVRARRGVRRVALLVAVGAGVAGLTWVAINRYRRPRPR